MKYLAILLTAAFVTIGASQAGSANGPGKGFVLGVETGQTLGVAGYYQLNDMIQIGSGLGLQVGDASYFYLSPQARFLFALTGDLYFVASAELQLLFGDQDATALAVKTAIQYWITKNFGVYGGVSALSLNFDPSVLGIGLLTPHVGAQFAFN